MQNLYLFITIINKRDFAEFEKFFAAHKVSPIYETLCDGAAASDTLSILGFEKSEKTIMQSLVTGPQVRALTHDLTYDMDIDLPNRGIALAVPLSSIVSRALTERISAQGESIAPPQDTDTERKTNMELVIAICSKGNSAEVMKLARAAGASGGTIVKAKGTAPEGMDTFFGMSLSNEKEIIYIVTKKEKKNEIMQAVVSFKTAEGLHPIAFSLPVSDIAGFRLMKD